MRLIIYTIIAAVLFSFIFSALPREKIKIISCTTVHLEKREYIAIIKTNEKKIPNDSLFVFATPNFFIQDMTGMWTHLGTVSGNNATYSFKVHYFGQGSPKECPITL